MHSIETERLFLTKINKGHENQLHRLHSDPLVVELLYAGVTPTRLDTRKRLRQFLREWKNNGFGFFAVYRKPYGNSGYDYVGRSGLRYLDDTREIEFGHCFRGDVSGQGLAPEAARAVLSFGFEDLALARIVSVVRFSNRRGLRALKKIGFRYVDDRWHYKRCMHYFVLHAEEFFDLSQSNGKRPLVGGPREPVDEVQAKNLA